MKEKWVVSAKKADFQAIGQHFCIDPVLARIMRNRGLTDLQEMNLYLLILKLPSSLWTVLSGRE